MLSRCRMNWLLPRPPFPSPGSKMSVDGRGGRSEIIRQRKSLVLYKSFKYYLAYRTYSWKDNIYSKSGQVQYWPRNLFVYNVVVKM